MLSVKVHEPVCLDSAQDLYFWWDHFLGDQIKDEWLVTGTMAVIDSQTGGIVRATTAAVAFASSKVAWGDIRSLLVSKKVTIEVRVKLNTATINDNPWIGLVNNVAADYIIFYSPGGSPNWWLYTRAGGALTTTDLGIALNTDYHILRLATHTHGGNHVHAFIDAEEVPNSPFSTNITALHLQPHLQFGTGDATARTADFDYVVVRQDR